MHTSKELAPEEDQGIVFSVIKGPKIRQPRLSRLLRREARQGIRELPGDRSSLCTERLSTARRTASPGMLLKAWDERERSSIKLKPLVAGTTLEDRGASTAFRVQTCRRCRAGRAAWPVQMVINSTAGFQAVLRADGEVEGRRTPKSGLFIVSDSDLDFNQPVVKVNIDPLEGERSRKSTWRRSAVRWRRCSVATTSNRFNLEGRFVSGDTAGAPAARGCRRKRLAVITWPTNTGQLVPLSTIVSIETGTDPKRR